MSFFERARAGYDNLAGRTDDAFDRATASKDLGEIDKHYRDLGVLAYLAATGRPVDQATQHRLLGALTALEQRGAIRDFTLHTTGGAPAGAPQAPQREGGSDGIPTPPPERAGRHGGRPACQRQRRGYGGGPARPAVLHGWTRGHAAPNLSNVRAKRTLRQNTGNTTTELYCPPSMYSWGVGCREGVEKRGPRRPARRPLHR